MKKHPLSFVFWLVIVLSSGFGTDFGIGFGNYFTGFVANSLATGFISRALAAEEPLSLRNKTVPDAKTGPDAKIELSPPHLVPGSTLTIAPNLPADSSSTIIVPNSQSNSQTMVLPEPLNKTVDNSIDPAIDKAMVKEMDKTKDPHILPLDDPKGIPLEIPKIVQLQNPEEAKPGEAKVEDKPAAPKAEDPKVIQLETPKAEDPKVIQLETPKAEDPKVIQLETPKAEDPKSIPSKRLTPADFLVKTQVVPQVPAQPVQPVQKAQPAQKADKAAKELPKTGKVDPDPAQQALEDFKKELPDPKQDPKKASPKAGDPLKIPDTAKENNDLGFLEGCWVGTRPEYASKRIIKEQFCFDAKGIGKRRVFDPQYAGTCIGATKAVVNSNGILEMNSSQMACDRGDAWAASSMICKGEGEKTPCSWVFRDEGGRTRGQQSYTINFVRE